MLVSNKERVSATITSSLVSELRKITKTSLKTQSAIIEEALRFWMNNKLAKDAKELANINFDDLPTEEEWFSLNSSE
jgi:metal-responsive CopG/Arc/MetJ family transcriptional regulator